MLSKLECKNKNERLNEYQDLEKMTPQLLVGYKGFENYSTEEAQLVINELENLAKIIYRHVRIKHKV